MTALEKLNSQNYYLQSLEIKPEKKQIEFMNKTKHFRFSAIMAGNQCGKSWAGSLMDSMHLTGLYDLYPWYDGKRFDGPITLWAASQTADFTRDNIQRHLFGDFDERGELQGGLIPKDLIINYTRRSRPSNAIDTAYIRHLPTGGRSKIQFKDFSQGYLRFAGGTVHVIHRDEDCLDARIITECKARLTHTDGVIYDTMTPTEGLTATVKEYWPEPSTPSHCLTMMSIEECERLSPKRQREIIATYPEHERECRAKGIPFQGKGKVFPFTDKVYLIHPTVLPQTLKVGIGIDFGFDFTAAVFCAYDQAFDTIYVLHEYKQAETPIQLHAIAIKDIIKTLWGEFARPPVFWPHDGSIRQDEDGATLASKWSKHLNMHHTFAHYEVLDDKGNIKRSNSVSVGIEEMTERMRSRRLQVFDSCYQLRQEIDFYHRKENKTTQKPEIVKKDDHLIDALRYFVMMKDDAEVISFDMMSPSAKDTIQVARHEFDVLGGVA